MSDNYENSVEVKIQYRPGMPELALSAAGDWIDLYTSEDVDMKAGEFRILDLGVCMQLPAGYEAIILPRSSTYKHWGISPKTSGVIDNSYAGAEDYWGWPVKADKDIFIPKHTRLCQFRIQKNQPKINFTRVARLGSENRGGYGSTGL